jgi:hypothetical protein
MADHKPGQRWRKHEAYVRPPRQLVNGTNESRDACPRCGETLTRTGAGPCCVRCGRVYPAS